MVEQEKLPRLLAHFPQDTPVPFNAKYGRRDFPGEILVTQAWHSSLGKIDSEKIRFRIVVITQPQEVSPQSLVHPRVAVCLPGPATPPYQQSLEKYRAIRERRQTYLTKTGKDSPDLQARESQQATRLAEREAACYAAGQVCTRSQPIPAREAFSAPEPQAWFDHIAQSLLQPSWEVALDYARCLCPDLKPATGPEEAKAQQSKLLEALSAIRLRLQILGPSLAGLGQPVEPKLHTALERLTSLTESTGWADFLERSEAIYPFSQALAEDWALLEKAEQLVPAVPEVVAARKYLEAVRLRPGDRELQLDRDSLLEQMTPPFLISSPHLWPSLKALFEWFQSRYRPLYLAQHRAYRQEIEHLSQTLAGIRQQLPALQRLNSIAELGKPVGADLAGRYMVLRPQVTICPSPEEEGWLVSLPVCPHCLIGLADEPPRAEVNDLQRRLEQALAEQQRRLSSRAIRHIITSEREPRLKRFIKVVELSDISGLVEVLDDELTDFIRQLLRSMKP